MRIDGNTTNLFNQKKQTEENETLNTKQLGDSFNKKTDNSLSDAFSFGFDQFKNNNISNEKILHATDEALEDMDKFTKNILDNIIGQFFGNNQETKMFPKALPENISEIFQNPYNMENTSTNKSGIIVETTQEYYQKQTFDFNGSVTIETPNRTFEMEISISITQEVYMSKSSKFGLDEAKELNPITLNHDKDENPFGDLEKLHFIFDQNKEEENSLFDRFEEMLGLFDANDSKKESRDIINIFSQKAEASYEFTSMLDVNNGQAVYLSNSQMNYSYESLSYSSSNMNNENKLDITI